jgi:hypothetical protein
MLISTLKHADDDGDDGVKRFLILRLNVIGTVCHELFNKQKQIVEVLRGQCSVIPSSEVPLSFLKA